MLLGQGSMKWQFFKCERNCFRMTCKFVLWSDKYKKGCQHCLLPILNNAVKRTSKNDVTTWGGERVNHFCEINIVKVERAENTCDYISDQPFNHLIFVSKTTVDRIQVFFAIHEGCVLESNFIRRYQNQYFKLKLG